MRCTIIKTVDKQGCAASHIWPITASHSTSLRAGPFGCALDRPIPLRRGLLKKFGTGPAEKLDRSRRAPTFVGAGRGVPRFDLITASVTRSCRVFSVNPVTFQAYQRLAISPGNNIVARANRLPCYSPIGICEMITS